MRHRSTAVPAALVASLALAACGSEALSKDEYVKQADAICKDAKEKQSKLATPNSAADIEKLANESKPLLEDEISRLRDLKAPDDLKDTANEAYDLLDQQLPKIDELKDAAKAKDTSKINEIATSAGKLSQEANTKARELGLKVCGS